MDKNTENEILIRYLISMADDELILGQRASEWCGHAPILEEDIAFANLALDEIGHAQLWYSLAALLSNQDQDAYPDELVFFRDVKDFWNTQLVELPNGDWAFTMLRQYLFDAAEGVRLERLSNSTYSDLANLANTVRKEELYHLRHTQLWVERLGQGTPESHRRMQKALDELWGYTAQLFDPISGEKELSEKGILPDSTKLRMAWEERIRPHLARSDLKVPEVPAPVLSRTMHTQHLTSLVKDMQAVARENEGASW